MKFSTTASFVLQAAVALGAAVTTTAATGNTTAVNVPPYTPPGTNDLSGKALTPKFNPPREVTIFNPHLTGKNSLGKKRGTTRTVPQPGSGLAAAVYTMGNNVSSAGNFIVALPVNSSGLLNYDGFHYGLYDYQQGARFKAEGSVYQDSLDSQSSLVQVGSRLFAVNAGSQSMTQYAVNCTDPTQLIPLGKVTTNGAYPNTLAVASENQIVCVGSTGQDAGIQCYTYNVGEGEVAPPQEFSGTTVSLPLPEPQGSGLPVGPADTLSQLLFTPDENYLIAVVKSALDSNGGIAAQGYINVYPITGNGLGTPVQSPVQGSAVLFGCVFQYNTYTMFCADPGVGALTLEINKSSLDVTVVNSVSAEEINPTGMNCWTALSPYANGPYYMTAVNENYIATFDQTSGSDNGNYINTHNFTNGNPQMIEMATANNFVYGLTYGLSNSEGQIVDYPYITVARDTTLQGGFQLEQNFPLYFDTDYEGMATFNPSDAANVCDFV